MNMGVAPLLSPLPVILITAQRVWRVDSVLASSVEVLDEVLLQSGLLGRRARNMGASIYPIGLRKM